MYRKSIQILVAAVLMYPLYSLAQMDIQRIKDSIINLQAKSLPVVEQPKLELSEADSTRLVAMREYYEYVIADYHHTHKVFEWQLFSSYIIFTIVILLVVFGMLLSWLQFRKTPSPRSSSGEGNLPVSDITLSLKDGIHVSSPVLGILILVISLAFFYLYLVEVYPINIVK